jgi:trimeric autotransporter adhesin
MRWFLFYTCFSFAGVTAYSQSGFTVAGGSFSGTGGSISYSAGLVDYAQLGNTTNCGIQQAYTVSPFPVSFLGINAIKQNTSVLVGWETSSEVNSSHFIVQRSLNGIDFSSEVGIVPATGNSATKRTYSLFDHSPVTGLNYYRIKQIDIDGRFSYSSVVAVSFEKNVSVSCYPNPALTFFRIYINNPAGYSYSLHELTGKLVKTGTISGSSTLVDVKNLQASTYLLTIYNGRSDIYSFRVIKL